MAHFGFIFGYIALIAFLPLIYVSVKTISFQKLKDTTFLRLLAKDFIRTVPICGLVLLPIFLFPIITKPYLSVIQLIFMPLMFGELGHIYLFGTRIGLNTFYTLFVSNIRETREYIGQNIPLILYPVAAFFFFTPFWFIWILPTPTYQSGIVQILCIITSVFISVPFIRNLFKHWPKFKDGYVLNPFSNVFYHYGLYRKNYQALKEKINQYKAPPFEKIVSRLSDDTKQTYIIVIGESANRMHCSCYGYFRNTNEFTQDLGDEMMYFQNVKSPFSQTIPSLEKTLSFATVENPNDLYDKGSIIDYFKQAGFKTYWLSNQYALDDTVITAMASHADYSKYYNFSGMKRFEKAGLDGAMIPDIQQFIQDPADKKVIFVHLIGSHSAYVNRYPAEFKHYTDNVPDKNLSLKNRQLLNSYDDSIRYTDYLIRQMIDSLKQIKGHNYLLYFSDHGEDIFDSTDTRILGHSELANEPMTAVPFMLWLSPELRQSRSDIPARATSQKPSYNLQDAIHFILDISSLSNPDYQAGKSILNP